MSAQPDPFLELARRAEARGMTTGELLAELLALAGPPLDENEWAYVERTRAEVEAGIMKDSCPAFEAMKAQIACDKASHKLARPDESS
jgi:hypothetical protein